MKRLLLVGGPSDVRRQLESKLGSEAQILDHWEYKKRFSGNQIPAGVELVVALTDMADHGLTGYAKEQAKRAGVPYVPIIRKWATASKRIKDKIAASGRDVPKDRALADVSEVVENATRTLPGFTIPCAVCGPGNPCLCGTRESMKVLEHLAKAVDTYVPTYCCEAYKASMETDAPIHGEGCKFAPQVEEIPTPMVEEPVAKVHHKHVESTVEERENRARELLGADDSLTLANMQETLRKEFGVGIMGIRAQKLRREVRKAKNPKKLADDMVSAIKMVEGEMENAGLLKLTVRIEKQGEGYRTSYEATPIPDVLDGIIE